MKQNIIIGATLAVALVVLGIYVLGQYKHSDTMTGQSEPGTVSNVAPNVTEETSDEVTGKGSLRSLLGLGKSQECQFVVRVDGMVQEGTAFYDGGNARVDTLVTGTGSPVPLASYMIMDEGANTMYMWSTAQGKQGIKMQLEPESAMESASESETSLDSEEAAVTPDMDVDYNCKPWRVDGSVFVPPADVEFMDMSDMQKMMEGIGDFGEMMPRM